MSGDLALINNNNNNNNNERTCRQVDFAIQPDHRDKINESE